VNCIGPTVGPDSRWRTAAAMAKITEQASRQLEQIQADKGYLQAYLALPARQIPDLQES
jgi:hypothetical protein